MYVLCSCRVIYCFFKMKLMDFADIMCMFPFQLYVAQFVSMGVNVCDPMNAIVLLDIQEMCVMKVGLKN